MSSLLTTAQITSLTGVFAQHFDTFSPFHTIVVNKKPIETIVDSNENFYPGYVEPSNKNNITFTPVNQSFNCIVVADKPGKEGQTFQETKTNLGKGKVKIKVKPDAAIYINTGVTESIILDGTTYIRISDDGIQSYLGLTYHYYLLERTN